MAIDIEKIREDLKKKNIKDIVIDLAIEFKLMNGKVNFHDKFIWTFIGILITSFIGGLITYIILNLLGKI